jgi:hypothetical protein
VAYETKVLLDGLVFGKGDLWYCGKPWFSDMGDHKVMTLTSMVRLRLFLIGI